MTASETVFALEAKLITPAEAVDQVMCERIDDVYARAASEKAAANRSGSAQGQRRAA